MAVKSPGRVLDLQYNHEVSMKSLGTSRIAVSLDTRRIVVKSLGRVWRPTGFLYSLKD